MLIHAELTPYDSKFFTLLQQKLPDCSGKLFNRESLTLAGRYWLAEPDAMAIRRAEAEFP